jgi:hypothetical protein
MPALIHDFDGIRRRRDDLRACSHVIGDQRSNLRELIESGSAWWSSDAVTDGADHFLLPSVTSTGTCTAQVPCAQKASHDEIPAPASGLRESRTVADDHWRRQRDGTLPRRVRLSPNAVRKEIEAWCAARVADRDYTPPSRDL